MENKELFKKALDFVLAREGGYANIKGDLGGMTYKGITQATYTTYLKSQGRQSKAIATEYKTGSVPKGLNYIHYGARNVDVVIHITNKEIEDIYYSRYWIAAGCHKMTKKFAVVAFDTAVNMGVSRVGEFLRACQYNDIEVFYLKRIEKYNEFAKVASQRQFLHGWLNRMFALIKFIDSL